MYIFDILDWQIQILYWQIFDCALWIQKFIKSRLSCKFTKLYSNDERHFGPTVFTNISSKIAILSSFELFGASENILIPFIWQCAPQQTRFSAVNCIGWYKCSIKHCFDRHLNVIQREGPVHDGTETPVLLLFSHSLFHPMHLPPRVWSHWIPPSTISHKETVRSLYKIIV